MINPIDNILTEWAYRVHNGMPDPKNQYHLVQLQESMKSLKVDGEVIDMVMNRLYEAKFNKKSLLKMRDDGDKVYGKIDKFIKDFVKKLNKSPLKPSASVTETQGFNIKSKSTNPRVDVTIFCKDIGNGSRQTIFDEASKFTGKLKSKYSSANSLSSAGHMETTIDDILVRIEFKGGKKSSGEASMDTDLKEGMVGAWFQSKWKKPVTKSNIGSAINQLLKDIPKMVGESSTVKSSLVKFLKGLPTSNPKAPVLTALNETLSAAITIKNKYKGWTWERDTIFDKIRSAGQKITKLTADKWNPGDVYIMKGNKSSTAITQANSMKTTSINQQIGPLNNLFVAEWGDTDGIVAVSLKMKKAQAGKGKQYLKKFNGSASDFDYNLTKDEKSFKTEEPEVLLNALIPQIDDWRNSIGSKLGSGYTYSSANAWSLNDEKNANFVFQKYASIKMFAYMVDKIKSDSGVFVDAAAFTLSLTGYNPTFFKVKGNSSGTAVSPEKYEAGGGIQLISDIKITDTNTNAGITFEFQVKNNDLGTGDLKMNIRFNGTTQATLEMLSASWS